MRKGACELRTSSPPPPPHPRSDQPTNNFAVERPPPAPFLRLASSRSVKKTSSELKSKSKSRSKSKTPSKSPSGSKDHRSKTSREVSLRTRKEVRSCTDQRAPTSVHRPALLHTTKRRPLQQQQTDGVLIVRCRVEKTKNEYYYHYNNNKRAC